MSRTDHDLREILQSVKWIEDKITKLKPAVAKITRGLTTLTTQGVRIMADVAALQAKISELEAAQKAESDRQRLQDEATETQIQALQQALDNLNQTGGLSQENQAAIDAANGRIQAVIDALNAEKPTSVNPLQA